jgi:hypothetical protein
MIIPRSHRHYIGLTYGAFFLDVLCQTFGIVVAYALNYGHPFLCNFDKFFSKKRHNEMFLEVDKFILYLLKSLFSESFYLNAK